MDLNLLVALEVLLSTKSVTEAADRLNLSQSATSSALVRLREVLGDEILVQSGKRMVPTPGASELLPQIRDILSRVDTLKLSVSKFDASITRRQFRVAASDYASLIHLTPAIKQIVRSAPGIQISVVPFFSESVFRDLTTGEIDLLLIPTQYPDPADCEREILATEPFVCMACANNPAFGERITLEQFVEARHVVMKPYGPARAIDEQFFNQNKIFRNIHVSVSLYSLIPEILAGTDAIGCVPQSLYEKVKPFLSLKVITPEFEMPRVTQSFIWHSSRNRDEALHWVRQVIIETTQSARRASMQAQPCAQSI